MTDILFFLPLVTLLAYLSVRVVIRYSRFLRLYDVPNERSHHSCVTPTGGGLGFISILLIMLFITTSQLCASHPFVLLSIFIVFVMGLYDDRHDVSAKKKFLGIFLAAFLMSFDSVLVTSFGEWYGYEFLLPYGFAVAFTMFGVAGFTNALNLIDGIDGLSSTISIIILLFFAFIGFTYEDEFMMALSTLSIATLIGFLLLNWNPAKIFMGDSGSLTLGYIISILAIMSTEYIHPVAVIYLAAIPILDTLIVMVRRMRNGKSPFRPDKTHLHHILVNFFDGDVKKTVYFLGMLQTMFSAIGYVILDSINKGDEKNIPLFSLMGFVLMFGVFYMIFTGMYRRQLELERLHS